MPDDPTCRPHDARAVRERRTRSDRRLFALRDNGDPYAREMLIDRFLPLARMIARRYEHRGEPLDDLVQVASLALVTAIDRYDPARSGAFSTYALPTIVGELKRHVRDRTWSVRPPRDLQELALQVDRAVTDLAAELDRSPGIAELGAAVGECEEHVLEALQARSAYSTRSLEACGSAADEGDRLQVELGGYDDGYSDAEARAVLVDLLRLVSSRERIVLHLRFRQDMTQAEIGRVLGVSQMQVSRILRGTLARLHDVADRLPANTTSGIGSSTQSPSLPRSH